MSNNNTSFSEVNDFLKCQQFWFNKYIRRINRKGKGAGPMALGTIGHLWLAEYYRVMQHKFGTNKPPLDIKIEAMAAANNMLARLMTSGEYETALFNRVNEILKEFIKTPEPYEFEILAVERKYGDVLPNNSKVYDPADPNNIYVVMIADLVVKPLTGPYKGRIGLLDHKFVENFPPESAVKINTQLVKQIDTLRGNGIPADWAAFNYLRTRKMDYKNNILFKRDYAEPNDVRIANVMREHVKVSDMIVYYKNIKPEVAQEKVVKVLNPYICGGGARDKECEFYNLCIQELAGLPTKDLIESFYHQGRDGYGG